MSKSLSRSDGRFPEDSHKNCKKTAKMTRLRRCQKKALSSLLEHEILPARVLRARIVVSILVGVHVHVVVALSQGISMCTLRLWSKLPRRRSVFKISTILFVCWRRHRHVLFSPSNLPMTLLHLACLVQLPCEELFQLLQSSLGPQELSHHPDDLS